MISKNAAIDRGEDQRGVVSHTVVPDQRRTGPIFVVAGERVL